MQNAGKSSKPEPIMFLLPNLFTTANLFFGSLAIYMVVQGRVYQSCICVLLATLFDVFDGRVARLARTSTLFGTEYDSLCDLVSFGVAPAVLVYTWGFQGFGRLGWAMVFIYLACGALRLAHFNASVKKHALEKNYFRGLPIPIAANFVVTMILLCLELNINVVPRSILMFVLFLISLLMVSPIPFRSFKDMRLFGEKPFSQLVVLVLLSVVVLMRWEINLFFAVGIYIFVNLAVFSMHHLRKVPMFRHRNLS